MYHKRDKQCDQCCVTEVSVSFLDNCHQTELCDGKCQKCEDRCENSISSDGLFEISEASNGEEGWEFCEKYKPELVLTDIRMPKMDGIQLLQEIRNNELEIKVIILSAYSDFEYARSAIVNGASDYLLKPFDDTALTECLNNFPLFSLHIFFTPLQLIQQTSTTKRLLPYEMKAD